MRRSARELADALEASATTLFEAGSRKKVAAEAYRGDLAVMLSAAAHVDEASAALMTEAARCIRRLDGHKRALEGESMHRHAGSQYDEATEGDGQEDGPAWSMASGRMRGPLPRRNGVVETKP